MFATLSYLSHAFGLAAFLQLTSGRVIYAVEVWITVNFISQHPLFREAFFQYFVLAKIYFQR